MVDDEDDEDDKEEELKLDESVEEKWKMVIEENFDVTPDK